VLGQPRREHLEVVVQPIAYRDAPGVGRKPQDIKARTLYNSQIEVPHRSAPSELIERIAQLGGFRIVVGRFEHRPEDVFSELRGAFANDGRICPKNNGGIANRASQPVAATAVQHAVECSPVAESCCLGSRRVSPLSPTVRCEGIEVE
jgi:hypothetical protein